MNLFFFHLEPRLTVQLLPPLVTGISSKDPLELNCNVIVAEDVILASYQFIWLRNDIPVTISDSRYIVCLYMPCSYVHTVSYVILSDNQ